MLKYIGRRLLMMIPVMLGVILIVFTLMYITPGDPVDTLLGDDATPEMAEQLREELGLNGTYIERLGKYLVNLAHGDLGICYSTKQPVMDRIIQTFPNSLKLAGCSVLLSVAIGLTLGIVSAVKQYSLFDEYRHDPGHDRKCHAKLLARTPPDASVRPALEDTPSLRL